MSRIILSLLSICILASCQKEISTINNVEIIESNSKSQGSNNNKPEKITICHKTNSPSNPWVTISINSNALEEHLLQGDIVPDADGDGYTKINPCGYGSQDDCDDNNAGINPGATEICDNEIDDNCNEQIDENCIPYVSICNQVWMLKNLDVANYRNGDIIPQAITNQEWIDAGTNQTGAWCFFANNTANGTIYGKLYNWYAVNDPRGLAPYGWHISSTAEWTSLFECQGGASVAGGKLKEIGTEYWESPNLGATNSSGFTGLPGGLRNFDGVFFYAGTFGVWWNSTEGNESLAFTNALYHNRSDAGGSLRPKSLGFAVRCVRDN